MVKSCVGCGQGHNFGAIAARRRASRPEQRWQGDGQDVTAVFAEDIARPVKAVIIEAEGPGGGNPYVEFTFQDEDHSWEWASSNMDMEPDDYEVGAA